MAKTQRIEIRVTPEEKGLLKVLAEKHHTDVAGWIRQRIFSAESFAPGEVVSYQPDESAEPVVVDAEDRRCSRCGRRYGPTTTLRRCHDCNGAVLP